MSSLFFCCAPSQKFIDDEMDDENNKSRRSIHKSVQMSVVHNEFLQIFEKHEKKFYINSGLLESFLAKIKEAAPHDVLSSDKIEKIFIDLGVDFDEIYYVFEAKYFYIGSKSKSTILDLINSQKVSLFSFLYSQEEFIVKSDMLLEYFCYEFKIAPPKNNDKGAECDPSYNDFSGMGEVKLQATSFNVAIMLSYLFAGAVLPLMHIYAHTIDEQDFKEFYKDCLTNSNIFLHFTKEILNKYLNDSSNVLTKEELHSIISNNLELMFDPKLIRKELMNFINNNKLLARTNELEIGFQRQEESLLLPPAKEKDESENIVSKFLKDNSQNTFNAFEEEVPLDKFEYKIKVDPKQEFEDFQPLKIEAKDNILYGSSALQFTPRDKGQALDIEEDLIFKADDAMNYQNVLAH